MKIAIVSKASILGGGASKVATELTNLLKQDGHFVQHYRRDFEYGFTKESSCVYGPYEKIAKKTYYKLKYFGLQEIIPWEYLYLKKEIKEHQFDLIHFHDLTTAISPFTLMLLSKRLPVIWTLHDTSAFTGGCINPFNCKKFMLNCYPCPQKKFWPMGGKFDLAFLYLKIKSKMHKKNIHLISPSNWLADFSTTNTIIKKKPFIIHNGVDTKAYKFLNKQESKRKINIPLNRFIILLTAHNVCDENKGFKYALETIYYLKELNPYILLVGNVGNNIKDILKEYNYLCTGFISNKEKLNIYYNAADIFINCSLADNFPLVVLETMASGTPTFGFETGGIPEMIQQDINGYLVENKDTKLLAKKIKEVYLNNQLPIFSENARNIAENHFSNKIFLKNHLKFYKSILTIN